MNSTSLSFGNPWLLLLLIPGIALALFPYLRLKPKRRHTRNRVTSLIIHVIIVLCSVLVLSEVSFHRTEQVDSEIFLVTDVSDSTKAVRAQMNEYVKSFIDNTDEKNKVGIVAFGYGNRIKSTGLRRPSELDPNGFASSYELDSSATDISTALYYAGNGFTQNTGAKKRIILLTDGIETDGSAIAAAGSINNNDIEIDAIFFEPESYTDVKEVQIDSIIVPENVIPLATVDIDVVLRSHASVSITLDLYDNDEKIGSQNVITMGGEEKVTFSYSFPTPNLHIIRAEIIAEAGEDQVSENNRYYNFVNIIGDKKVLIIDGSDLDTQKFTNFVKENGFLVDSVTPDAVPETASDLAQYGEVIMMNVDTEDLPTNYGDVLDYYVNTLGGGLLTTGGENTYANGHMENNKYADLLPIKVSPEANNPRAIVVVLDISNSMFMYDVAGKTLSSKPGDASGLPNTRIAVAREGLEQSVETAINSYDYVGLVVYGRNKKNINDTEIVFELTPATHKEEMIEKISNIKRKSSDGGTNYDEALQKAQTMLETCSYPVNKKSVLFINDDDGKNDDCKTFADTIKNMTANSITFSSIVIANSMSSNIQTIDNLTKNADGSSNVHLVNNATSFANTVFELCKSFPSLKINSITGGSVRPSLASLASPITKDMAAFPTITGYNGTSAKTTASVPVTYHNKSPYTDDVTGQTVNLDNIDPIYAQWSYGNGKVGSLMVDLSEKWTGTMFNDPNGVTFMTNVVNQVYTNKELSTADIRAMFDDKNYTQLVNVFTNTGGGEYVTKLVMTSPSGEVAAEIDLNVISSEDYSGSLQTMQEGVYKVEITKYNGTEVVSSIVTYTYFSYSAEYNTFYDIKEVLSNLNKICEATGGKVYYSNDNLQQNINQMSIVEFDINIQLPLMIFALVLFLLDICVRKFNFLWPHEIIQNRKNKNLN